MIIGIEDIYNPIIKSKYSQSFGVLNIKIVNNFAIAVFVNPMSLRSF